MALGRISPAFFCQWTRKKEGAFFGHPKKVTLWIMGCTCTKPHGSVGCCWGKLGKIACKKLARANLLFLDIRTKNTVFRSWHHIFIRIPRTDLLEKKWHVLRFHDWAQHLQKAWVLFSQQTDCVVSGKHNIVPAKYCQAICWSTSEAPLFRHYWKW